MLVLLVYKYENLRFFGDVVLEIDIELNRLWKFQEFYEDLFLELSKYGEIESLNVCDNLADDMVCSFGVIYIYIFYILWRFYFQY